jgi:YVTN family beta-propeller protein
MDIGILGPLTVTRDGRDVPIGAAKQRALVAVFALHRNEVIPTATLIDELWGDDPPATATKIVHTYVSQLRKVLGDDVLQTRAGGYLLRATPDEVDSARFESLLALGRKELTSGRPQAADELLRTALALWRGRPLAEFRVSEATHDEVERLEQLELVCLESRLEADIACGGAATAIPELQVLVRQHPLRESLRGSLMLALYRTGRQADALAVYADTRATLVDQLGVDPSEHLQHLHAAILAHDPALESGVAPPVAAALSTVAPAPSQAPPPSQHSADRPVLQPMPDEHDSVRSFGDTYRTRKRWPKHGGLRPLTIAACIGVVALTALTVPASDGSTTLSALKSSSVGFINNSGHTMARAVTIPGLPTAIAVDGSAIWAVEPSARSLVRIDTSRGAIVQTIPVGNDPSAVLSAGGSVWVANHDDGTVSQISPETNAVVNTIPVGAGPLALAEGFGSVWVTNGDDRTLTRIDEHSDDVLATIHTNAVGRGIVASVGSIWVTDEFTDRLVGVDPRTNAVDATISVGKGPTAITALDGALWVINALDGTVSRVDPVLQAVTLTLIVPSGSSSISAKSGAVWVGSDVGSEVTKIDAAHGAIMATTPLSARPEAVSATDTGVWISSQARGAGHRGGRLVVAGDVDTIDPSAGELFPTYTELAYDALTATRWTGGSAGTQIVPDLALALPEPTNGGTTYTFRLRPGIRYSDGSMLQPSDFRLGLERLLLLNTDLDFYFADVVGAPGCGAAAKCDLSSGVTVSGPSMVTFHLSRPDPRFLEVLDMLVPTPQGTPLTDVGVKPVPGTGPYAIADFLPGSRLTFGRNRYFSTWTPARPDGYPDEIDLVMGLNEEDADEGVAAGRVDIDEAVSESPAAKQLGLAHPGLVHTEDEQATVAVFLNTTMPPFNDIRVRRALNFAVDRQHIVGVFGAELATATCQILAPTTSGYRPYCPYTVDPSSDGQWRGPDLTTARSLVAASGTKGQDVTLWTFPDYADAGQEVAGTLDSLGYHTSVHEVGDADTYFADLGTTTGIQAGLIGWFDSPLAIDAFASLTCDFDENRAKFCDPGIDAEINQLAGIEPLDPGGSADLAAHIDREVTDLAPWVPLFNPQTLVLTSARVGNYQSERGELLIDQLWVQ